MVIRNLDRDTLNEAFPIDWEIAELGEVAQFLDGKRKPIKVSDRAKIQGHYPYYGASGVVDYINDYLFDEHLILLGEDGENIVSRNTRLAFEVSGKIWVNNHAHVIRPNDDMDVTFLCEYLESLAYDQHNSGSAQPKINLQTCKSLRVVKPPLQEQQAIAEALSDADALIASLEKLIEKKSLIGRELRRRLIPESLGNITAGTFVEATIDGLVDCLDNERIPLNNAQRSKMRGDIPYCGANGILDYIDQYIFDEDIILLAEDGGHFDEFETRPIAYQMSGKCWVNNHAHILRAKQPILNDYIFHALVHKDIATFLASGTRAKLNKSELLKITIFVPRNVDEANRIGQILNETNDEITSLSSKLNKAKKVKAGMMQELLTGRTRLI